MISTLPAADIHSVIPNPCFSASAPARTGAAVAPTISPVNVASPIDVAANCGGTLSVGTSTIISAANPWPLFVKNNIAANSHGNE